MHCPKCSGDKWVQSRLGPWARVSQPPALLFRTLVGEGSDAWRAARTRWTAISKPHPPSL